MHCETSAISRYWLVRQSSDAAGFIAEFALRSSSRIRRLGDTSEPELQFYQVLLVKEVYGVNFAPTPHPLLEVSIGLYGSRGA